MDRYNQLSKKDMIIRSSKRASSSSVSSMDSGAVVSISSAASSLTSSPTNGLPSVVANSQHQHPHQQQQQSHHHQQQQQQQQQSTQTQSQQAQQKSLASYNNHRKSYPSCSDINISFSSSSIAGSIQDENLANNNSSSQCSLTQAGLEDFSRTYYEQHSMYHHQKQSSYAQSEGYHSYVSSSDSSSTPFLDRLRQDSELLLSRSTNWASQELSSPQLSSTNSIADNNSSESTSSTETLKWHGSMSDVSVTSHTTNNSTISGSGSSQLIAHSSRVRTPQRHNSESVLYMTEEQQQQHQQQQLQQQQQVSLSVSGEDIRNNNSINAKLHMFAKDRSSRNNNRLFPISTYTELPSSNNFSLLEQLNNSKITNNSNWQSVAERISELEKQNQNQSQKQRYTYLDPSKTHRVSNPALKALQKNAVQSYFERQQLSAKEGNNNTSSNSSSSSNNNNSIKDTVQPQQRPQSLNIPSQRTSISSYSSVSDTINKQQQPQFSVATSQSVNTNLNVFKMSPTSPNNINNNNNNINTSSNNNSNNNVNHNNNNNNNLNMSNNDHNQRHININTNLNINIQQFHINADNLNFNNFSGQSSAPPPPPRGGRASLGNAPLRRTSSASEYSSARDKMMQSRQNLSKDLLGPMIMGPIISVDDWVPERPPKNPLLRIPSPELPPPPPTINLDADADVNLTNQDEPLPPPPPELIRHTRQLSEPDTKSNIASRRNSFAGQSNNKKPVYQPPAVPKKPTSMEFLQQKRSSSSLGKQQYHHTPQPQTHVAHRVILNGGGQITKTATSSIDLQQQQAKQPLPARLSDNRMSLRKRAHNSTHHIVTNIDISSNSNINSNSTNHHLHSAPPLKPRMPIITTDTSVTKNRSNSKASYLPRQPRDKFSLDPDHGSYKLTLTSNEDKINHHVVVFPDDLLTTTTTTTSSAAPTTAVAPQSLGKCNLPDVLPIGVKYQNSTYNLNGNGDVGEHHHHPQQQHHHHQQQQQQQPQQQAHTAPIISTNNLKSMFQFQFTSNSSPVTTPTKQPATPTSSTSSLSNNNSPTSPPPMYMPPQHPQQQQQQQQQNYHYQPHHFMPPQYNNNNNNNHHNNSNNNINNNLNNKISPKYTSQTSYDLKKTQILESPKMLFTATARTTNCNEIVANNNNCLQQQQQSPQSSPPIGNDKISDYNNKNLNMNSNNNKMEFIKLMNFDNIVIDQNNLNNNHINNSSNSLGITSNNSCSSSSNNSSSNGSPIMSKNEKNLRGGSPNGLLLMNGFGGASDVDQQQHQINGQQQQQHRLKNEFKFDNTKYINVMSSSNGGVGGAGGATESRTILNSALTPTTTMSSAANTATLTTAAATAAIATGSSSSISSLSSTTLSISTASAATTPAPLSSASSPPTTITAATVTDTDSLKLVQRTEIVLRVNATATTEAGSQTDDDESTVTSASGVMTTTTTGGAVASNSPTTTTTATTTTATATNNNTSITGEISELVIDINNRRQHPSQLSMRRKHPEEIDCDKLSKDLVSQLSPSDKLHHILAPKSFKSSSDYVSDLYKIQIAPRPPTKRDVSTSTLDEFIGVIDTRKSMSVSGGVDSSNSSSSSVVINGASSGASVTVAAVAATAYYSATTTTTTAKASPGANGTTEAATMPVSISAAVADSTKASKLITRYNREMTLINGDCCDLTKKKEELVARLGKKLQILTNEQATIAEESTANDLLGNDVAMKVAQKIRPNDASKFRSYIDDVGYITMLLLSLSGRLAKTENVLHNMLIENANANDKKMLEVKRDRLLEQLEEAKQLKDDIDRRGAIITKILEKALTMDEYADYDYFINMKAKLIVDQREIADKIKLGEEQLSALKDTLVHSEC